MRYGADVIEATPLPNSNSGKAPTAADCQAACLAFFDSPSSAPAPPPPPSTSGVCCYPCEQVCSPGLTLLAWEHR